MSLSEARGCHLCQMLDCLLSLSGSDEEPCEQIYVQNDRHQKIRLQQVCEHSLIKAVHVRALTAMVPTVVEPGVIPVDVNI